MTRDQVEGLGDDDALRRRAQELYGSDDIEIDDNAAVAVGERHGAWVQAWVFVPGDDCEASIAVSIVRKASIVEGGGAATAPLLPNAHPHTSTRAPTHTRAREGR